MMSSYAGEGGSGGEARAATRSASLFAEASQEEPPCVYVAVTEAAAPGAKACEERATLLPAGFDAVESARDQALDARRDRCCASRRPPAGWRVALGAAAAWTLIMLGGWTGVVMAQRSRGSAPAMLSMAKRATAAADICDPLELQACEGSQPWWDGGIVYQARACACCECRRRLSLPPQVYPRSFQDSDGDGVGDLQGTLQRIDFIASLNVSAIWLSPIFPSPMVRRAA